MVPTVTNHAGFISVKLDHFRYFGAELNFFVKLRRTERSYISHGAAAYFFYILVGGLLTTRKEQISFTNS